MARETLTKLIDDLDGGPANETVTFGLDGHTYEIDLSTKNATKLRSVLEPYVEKGTRDRSVRSGRRTAGRRSATTAEREQSKAIREWALGKGLDVAQHGRIRQEIVDEYHRRGPGRRARAA